jgi:hypothetical protein
LEASARLGQILSIIAVAAASDGDNETEWTPLNLYLAPSEQVRVVCQLYQVRHEKNKNRRRRGWELCQFAHQGINFYHSSSGDGTGVGLMHPPVQMTDDEAYRCVEQFIRGERDR